MLFAMLRGGSLWVLRFHPPVQRHAKSKVVVG